MLTPEQLAAIDRCAVLCERDILVVDGVREHVAALACSVLDAAARENAKLRARLENPLLHCDPETGKITNLTDARLRERLARAVELLRMCSGPLINEGRDDLIQLLAEFLREIDKEAT